MPNSRQCRWIHRRAVEENKLFAFLPWSASASNFIGSIAEQRSQSSTCTLNRSETGVSYSRAAIFMKTCINGRMDWTINQKHSAYFSVSTQANDSLNDQSDGTMDLTEGTFTVNHLQVANLSFNSAFTPTLVNQLPWYGSIGTT